MGGGGGKILKFFCGGGQQGGLTDQTVNSPGRFGRANVRPYIWRAGCTPSRNVRRAEMYAENMYGLFHRAQDLCVASHAARKLANPTVSTQLFNQQQQLIDLVLTLGLE